MCGPSTSLRGATTSTRLNLKGVGVNPWPGIIWVTPDLSSDDCAVSSVERRAISPPAPASRNPDPILTVVVFAEPPGLDGILTVGAEHGDVVIHVELQTEHGLWRCVATLMGVQKALGF